MFCLHVFLYTMCMPAAKKESEPPEVELQTVVGAENQTLWKMSQWP